MKGLLTVRFCLSAALVALLAFACNDDDDAGTSGAGNAAAMAECDVLGWVCHDVDDGDGPLAACHELGHSGDTAACSAGFGDCLGLCLDAAGDTSGEEDPHCRALGHLCHEVDDGNGSLAACHELGHSGDAAKCGAEFADCADQCLAAAEGAETHAGGTGGATDENGGAAHLHGGAAGMPGG